MSGKEPLVSVICIFLDAEEFIAEAIDSVLGQSFTDWELILVDDGARDGSSAYAASLADRFADKVRYLAHPDGENRGMSASRNLGLAHARGEYIAFIDADDVWRPEKLRLQVDAFEEHRSAGMVCGRVNYWQRWNGGADRPVQTGGHAPAILLPPEALLQLYPVGRAPAAGPSEVMIRKSVLESVGGFEEQFRGMFEDQACFVKIYARNPVMILDDVLLDYRIHENSWTSRAEQLDQTWEGQKAFYSWLRDWLSGQEFPGRDEALHKVDRELFILRSKTVWKIARKLRVWRDRLLP